MPRLVGLGFRGELPPELGRERFAGPSVTARLHRRLVPTASCDTQVPVERSRHGLANKILNETGALGGIEAVSEQGVISAETIVTKARVYQG